MPSRMDGAATHTNDSFGVALAIFVSRGRLNSGCLDLVGGLNDDSFPKGVERPDPEVGIFNHLGVGHATIRGVLEFEPDLKGIVRKHDDFHVEHPSHARMPGNKGVDAFRDIRDGEMTLGIRHGIIGIRHGHAPRSA